jgi:hypothetical protein
MMNRILSNGNAALVVLMNSDRLGKINMHLRGKLEKPDTFFCSFTKGNIFSFRRRTSYSLLLATCPSESVEIWLLNLISSIR